ncbi:MAG TPA: alanine racemase [Candidatus Limnocylindrales bacterium]|nr:alanine racemase [Candidatus Limnocylindrales bacterium]
MSSGPYPRAIDAELEAAGLPALGRTSWLEIDLDALATNLEAIRSVAGSGVRVVPVVKADAYGHGLAPIALALERLGADGLAVATLDEALALRDSGIRHDLLLLQPIRPALAAAAAEAGITVTLGDRAHVDSIVRAIGAVARSPRLRVELEIETGLGRGGIDVDEAAEAASLVRATPGLELVGAWSHLQAPEDAERSRRQAERFERFERFGRGGDVARHLSSSGGLLAATAPRYDGVRPGLATYGLVPDELLDVTRAPGAAGRDLAARLRPVMALRARPVRVAELPAGWGVSYGPTWVAGRASRIATLPVGYGDGWPRSLSNRAEVLVRGVRAPLVGNVAMDAVMADVTDVPGPPVDVAEVFTLLGSDGAERISAHDLARSRTTNAWEVVTSMSARLTRVYYLAAVPVGLRSLTSLALTGPRDSWPASSFGTGTSATWRSTRS